MEIFSFCFFCNKITDDYLLSGWLPIQVFSATFTLWLLLTFSYSNNSLIPTLPLSPLANLEPGKNIIEKCVYRAYLRINIAMYNANQFDIISFAGMDPRFFHTNFWWGYSIVVPAEEASEQERKNEKK